MDPWVSPLYAIKVQAVSSHKDEEGVEGSGCHLKHVPLSNTDRKPTSKWIDLADGSANRFGIHLCLTVLSFIVSHLGN